jgi:ribonucleoside-diphosphate reductase alpha chain
MTMLDDRTADVQFTAANVDYFALNAALNQWSTDADGNKVIALEKDKEAAKAYFLNHINPNTQYFLNLNDKLTYLVSEGYYEAEFLEKYDFAFIKKAYQHAYAKDFRFPTFMSAYRFYSTYALRTNDKKRYLERYEDRVVALALYIAGGNKKLAMDIIDVSIGSLFQAATPTYMNAGKAQRGELVSCFLLDVQDDLNSIFRAVNSAAQLSKRGGGVAINLSNIRGKGDPIKKILNQSGGIIPWMKILEDTFKAVDQLGTRAGAGAVYLNAHHIDVLDFLDTKRENADEALRIKTLSLGIVMSDITYELAAKGEEMYLFSPYDIEQVYGKQMAYLDITAEYHNMVEDKRIRKEKVPGGARRFLQIIAEIQSESGYPYIINIDAANRANAVKGRIIMSNLCTEILQVQEPGVISDDLTYALMGKDISCNLGSFNVRLLLESGEFAKHVETAVRMLTFVSDASDIKAVPTVASGNRRSHAIGIGAMNMHGAFGHWEMFYGDEESLDLTSAYFHLLTYNALKASNKIAKERKETFDGFAQSKYADGSYFEKFIADDVQELLAVKTDKVRAILHANNLELPTREEWIQLREDVKKHGLYNQNLQAVAPTGSISYLSNSTPSLLPIPARVESRKEGRIGRVAMAAPEMNMHNIQYFQTAYEVPTEFPIDVYSVAQYFIDQAASLTVHMPAGSGTKEIVKTQLYAFSKGKASKKALEGRKAMLAKYPQGEIKSLYYYRIQAEVLDGVKSDTVGASGYSECVSCQL